jgi:Tol biopolymer transport system component
MSPEQVLGREIDYRSDIFSFGLVLYEMLAGRRAFPGESAIEVMNAIVNEPPLPLPETVPLALRGLVAGCLEKDPADRFESARDLALSLRALSTGSGFSSPSAKIDSPASNATWRWLIPAFASLTVLALLWALYIRRPVPLDISSLQFKPLATDAEDESHGCWSADGKSVAYLKVVDGRRQVMFRNLDSPSPTPLTSMPSGIYASAPLFSPDSGHVYFIASETLWFSAIIGGEPREVLRASVPTPSPALLAGSLSPDGKTLAFWQRYEEGGKQYSGLWISSPPGARPRKYEPAALRVEGAFMPVYLRFSPDGSQIAVAGYQAGDEHWVWMLPWPDGPGAKPRKIFTDHSFIAVTPFDWMPDSRRICLSHAGDLWIGDTRSGKLQRLTASPVGVVTHPSVSPDGSRLLVTVAASDYDMIRIPLDGSPPGTMLATARSEQSPSWFAAGDLLAFITDRSGESEIWLRNPSGSWERPVVGQNSFPTGPAGDFENVSLSPDGTRLAYGRHGRIWISPISGGHASEATAGDEFQDGSPSWSPDSSSITYRVFSGGKGYVAVAQLGSQESQFLVPGTAGQCLSAPVWSPDRNWIACGSDNQTILLVSPEGKQHRRLPSPVSAASNGFVLLWSRDTKMIYVASSHTGNARLYAVEVETGKSRSIAEYVPPLQFLCPTTYSLSGSLSPDGKSFVTTVRNTKSDLWTLEGFPRPRRHWF